MEAIKEELGNKKENPKWGGPRPNSGRPKGGENQATKDKRVVKEEMKQRIMRSKDSLLNSQMNLAKGCQFLFVIETTRFKDKDGKWKEERKKPRIVENQNTIEKYLAGELDNEKDEYYFMTTQKPDNKAIDSMFDRAFDKARQNVGLDGGEEDKPITVINYVNATRKIPTPKLPDTDKPSV